MKEIIKKILIKLGIFENIKEALRRKKRLTKNYKFENRKKDKEKVCFVLAGYKKFTYEIIFKRLVKFLPEDIEVCILSSGKYSEKLSKIAKEHDWSYLSTKRNCVSLIQNVAIDLYDKAKYIYKLDEDIFITKGFFETLYNTYEDCKKNGNYNPGIIAPTIPINGFGNMKILQKYNLIEKYNDMFEKPIFAAGRSRMVENNPEVAKFFWGEGEYLPNIDEINNLFSKEELTYDACPIRFSIGAILFERELWNDMGMLEVKKGPCMGLDEENICAYCMNNSRPIIVSGNSVVGHLSFGNQNKIMEEYFKNNNGLFDIHE